MASTDDPAGMFEETTKCLYCGSTVPRIEDPTGYRVSTFYVGSSNAKAGDPGKGLGHVEVPTSIWGQLDKIIQQKSITEYKTKQDFVRDAIKHRLHYIQKILDDEQLAAILRDQYSIGEQENIVRAAEAAKAAYETVEASCVKFTNDEDWYSLRQAVESAERTLPNVQEHWKERWANLIDKYQRMLKNVL